MTATTTHLSLKAASAPKAGQRAKGAITYRVLTDVDRNEVFFRIEGNQGSGWFSRELVAFSRVDQLLSDLRTSGQPLAAKSLRPAFMSRSVNNAGFLVAVLRAEGLLAPDPDSEFLQVVTGDWPAWKQAVLESSGEPYALSQANAADITAECGPAADREHPQNTKKRASAPRAHVRSD